MRWAGAIGCLLALAFAGCGGEGSQIIPWKPLLPPRQPMPPLARPCLARDLRATPLDATWNGATGNLAGGVWVRNVSGRACSLVGRPVVRFAGRVPTRVKAIPAYGDDSLTRPPLSSLRALAPGKGASLGLVWSQSWCGPAPHALLVTLAGTDSTLRIPNGAAPRCNDPGVPTTETRLGVSHWVPSSYVLPHLPLRAELIGRYHLTRGQQLRYEIALVNTSHRPFRFRRCPLYREGVTREFVFVLNCRPAGAIPAGGRAIFEMRLPGPVQRNGGLTWDLPQVDADAFVDARVVVDRP